MDLIHLFEQNALTPSWILCGFDKAYSYEVAQHILCKQGIAPHIVKRQMEIGSYPNFFYLHKETEIHREEIDPLFEFLFKSPSIPGWRVVIINSLDRMNRFGHNALLKVLEEPPVRVLFLLMASRLDYLPKTIISRCQCLYRPVLHEETEINLDPQWAQEHYDVFITQLPLWIEKQIKGGRYDMINLFEDVQSFLSQVPKLHLDKNQVVFYVLDMVKNAKMTYK